MLCCVSKENKLTEVKVPLPEFALDTIPYTFNDASVVYDKSYDENNVLDYSYAEVRFKDSLINIHVEDRFEDYIINTKKCYRYYLLNKKDTIKIANAKEYNVSYKGKQYTAIMMLNIKSGDIIHDFTMSSSNQGKYFFSYSKITEEYHKNIEKMEREY